MTPHQRSLYWREWARVRRIDPQADRHTLHMRAIGAPKSSSALTNADLDRVLAEFRAISQPAALGPQLRAQDQPAIRLRWAIQRRQIPDLARLLGSRTAAATYLQAILDRRFAGRSIDDLDIRDLNHLRMTLAARINALQSAPATPPDPQLTLSVIVSNVT
jgi:hypothetical protein